MVAASLIRAVAGFGPVYSGNWCQISVAIKVLEEAGGQGDQVECEHVSVVSCPERTETPSSRENRDIPDPRTNFCDYLRL